MGSFALVALSIWAAMKDWPYNVLFGALCIDWIFGALIDLIHDLPDIDRWGVKADERHLLRELQHLILGRGRVFFVTRQFDPGNARFTYRQINSIALTEIEQETPTNFFSAQTSWKVLICWKHLEPLIRDEKGVSKGAD